ncbi:MAG: hypothetical protein ACRC2T_13870 [Thermoguttaceae bacterium]
MRLILMGNGVENRIMRKNNLIHMLCVIYVLCNTSFAAAQFASDATNTEQQTEQENEKEIHFRKIHVPNNDFYSWPITDNNYLLYPKTKFDEIVADSKKENTATSISSAGANSVIEHLHLSGSFLENFYRGMIQNSPRIAGDGIFKLRYGVGPVHVEPLGFWLENAKFSDGSDAVICNSSGKLELQLPDRFIQSVKSAQPAQTVQHQSEQLDAATAPASVPVSARSEEVNFQWLAQGKKNSQGGITFEIVTPHAKMIELELTVPAQYTLTSTEGIVFEVTSQEPQQPVPTNSGDNANQTNNAKKYLVSLGIHNKTQITLTPKERPMEIREQTQMHQAIRYNLRPEGVGVVSSFVFDKPVTSITDVLVELDFPLNIFAVKNGSEPIVWHPVSPDQVESGKYRLVASLAPGAKELIIEAECPVVFNEMWKLPRIQLFCEHFLWTETRANIFINEQLILAGVNPIGAFQTSGRTLDTNDRRSEGYSFQYFEPDSQIELELGLKAPGFIYNCGTQLDWEEDRVSSTSYLDFSKLSESPLLVKLQIQPNWLIDTDSIEFLPNDDVFFWEEENETESRSDSAKPASVNQNSANPEKSNSILVYLKKPTKMRVHATFPLQQGKTPNLYELVPFIVSNKNGTDITNTGGNVNQFTKTGNGAKSVGNLLAITTRLPNQFQIKTSIKELPKDYQMMDPLVRECFFEDFPPSNNGAIFDVDPMLRSIEVELAPIEINYDSQVQSVLGLQDDQMTQTCRFICRPLGSRIDRILVHFSQSSEQPWSWLLEGEKETLTAKKLNSSEINNLNLNAQNANIAKCGDVWEIKLHSPRSGPFLITATRKNEVLKDVAVPLPTLLDGTSKLVDVFIDSIYETNVDVIHRGLNPIPISAPPRNEYPTIRAAFRYDPVRNNDSTQNPLLIVKPSENDSMLQSAWVWMLRLNSQFESMGTVRQKATFLVENRGRKEIRIKLNENTKIKNVLAVWIEDKRIAWSTNDAEQVITLQLPARKRFIAVSLEYWYESKPLMQQKKLRAEFPEIDIPVFSGTWIAWTPPDFQAFLRTRQTAINWWDIKENLDSVIFAPGKQSVQQHTRGDQKNSLSTGYAKNEGSTQPFDPLTADSWNNLWNAYYRKNRCQRVAERLVEKLGNEKQLREYLNPRENAATTRSADGIESSGFGTDTGQFELTWGNVLGNVEFQNNVFGNAAEVGPPRIIVDWLALRGTGLFSNSPINIPLKGDNKSRGYSTLENAGVVLLFFDERSLLITSSLSAAKSQNELGSLVGEQVKIMYEGPLEELFRNSLAGEPHPQWVGFVTWKSGETNVGTPWKFKPSSTQIFALCSGWSATETLLGDSHSGVYIAYKPVMIALRWFAVLLVVALSRIKPFSNILVQCTLLVFFGILSVTLHPFYAVIPTGAFLGSIFAIGFILLADTGTSKSNQTSLLKLTHKIGTGVAIPVIQDSDSSFDADYEVRELRPFNKPPTQKESGSFFDTLKDDM